MRALIPTGGGAAGRAFGLLLLFLFVAVFLSGPRTARGANPPPPYTLSEIPQASAFPTGVNGDGQVSGYWTIKDVVTGFVLPRAFYWDGKSAQAVQLGTLQNPGQTGGTSLATAINSNGLVVGWATDANNKPHAFKWDSSAATPKMVALADLGFGSAALGVNDSGIAVGYVTDDQGTLGAAWWDAAGTLNRLYVGVGPGANFKIYGVSSAGDIVVGEALPLQQLGPYTLFVGKLGVNHTSPFITQATADDWTVGIDQQGHVTGVAYDQGKPSAFIWPGGISPPMYIPGYCSRPNDQDQCVGSKSDGSLFAWQDGTFTALPLVASGGLAPTQPTALSDVPTGGEVPFVVGLGSDSGSQVGFLAAPFVGGGKLTGDWPTGGPSYDLEKRTLTLTFAVKNTGQTAAKNVEVDFYGFYPVKSGGYILGDPLTGGPVLTKIFAHVPPGGTLEKTYRVKNFDNLVTLPDKEIVSITDVRGYAVIHGASDNPWISPKATDGPNVTGKWDVLSYSTATQKLDVQFSLTNQGTEPAKQVEVDFFVYYNGTKVGNPVTGGPVKTKTWMSVPAGKTVTKDLGVKGVPAQVKLPNGTTVSIGQVSGYAFVHGGTNDPVISDSTVKVQ